MKFLIKGIILIVVLCGILTGCDFEVIPGIIFDMDSGIDKQVETQTNQFFDEVLSDSSDLVIIEKPESQKDNGDKVTSAGQAYNSITEVYYAVADSVVEITTEVVQTSLWGQYIDSGAGSGVIIEKSGIIVTNYHVIEGARSVTVRLTDGSEYQASFVGADEPADLAIIKINPGEKELTVASLGCSADLEVGEDVVALGNPLGSLGGTLTSGIISARERTLNVNGNEMVLLQTNAAINPGNSGGGLFNMAGQLVGIVNAKVSEEGIEGLGFAIPIDIAYVVIRDLVEYGYVRGVVDSGLTVMDVTKQNLPYAYQKYGITTTGVIIVESKNTDKLKHGDKIISINGTDISSSSDVEFILRSCKVGDVIKTVIERNGDRMEIDLPLAEKVPDSVSFE